MEASHEESRKLSTQLVDVGVIVANDVLGSLLEAQKSQKPAK